MCPNRIVVIVLEFVPVDKKNTFTHICLFMRDFSSFDIKLLHLELQTCFVLPGLVSAIIMPAEFSVKIIS